ncbi:hypothetical protein HDU97_010460 [Phlyctochytrium planicorne]|nr:hypothetical protein HDU97_010460 [Phlyctochytrium planicorne]
MASRNSRIVALLNYRLRITVQDGRTLVGQMLAFDKHMNVVLSECEEYRKIKPKGIVEREEKRSLGLVILRGENIVSLSVEGPPPVTADEKKGGSGGVGVGRPAGRGLPLATPTGTAPMGLSGPVRGVGGPPPGAAPPMGRGFTAPPVSYGRPPMPGMAPPFPGRPPMPGMPGMPPPMPGMPGMPMPAPGAPPFPFPPGRGMPMPPPGFRPPPPGFRPPPPQ